MNFVGLFIAHVVGDIFFQGNKMALTKGQNTFEGWMYCFVHVLIYSATIYAYCLYQGVVSGFDLVLFLGIYIPHFIVDKFSLGYQWMKLNKMADRFTSESHIDNAFAAVIYFTVDQTMHIGSLYILFELYS